MFRAQGQAPAPEEAAGLDDSTGVVDDLVGSMRSGRYFTLRRKKRRQSKTPKPTFDAQGNLEMPTIGEEADGGGGDEEAAGNGGADAPSLPPRRPSRRPKPNVEKKRRFGMLRRKKNKNP